MGRLSPHLLWQATVTGLEQHLERLKQAQLAAGQQAAALRERLRRLQNSGARARTMLSASTIAEASAAHALCKLSARHGPQIVLK